jgi:cellulose synthase/poly-beta-1,6-N-acetylglucosamine synthase-like glycosyltransferase
MDADSIIMPEALGKLMSRFIDEPALVAVGGAISPGNGIVIRERLPTRLSGRIPILLGVQIIEYLRSMTTWRTGWSYPNGLLIIGGALTAFRRDAMVKVGGYSANTCTEDLDMILTLHSYHLERDLNYFIWTVPDVICWTRAPVSLDRLRSQRIRWMTGALQCISKHRSLAYNRRNMFLGWISFPHFVFIEAAAPLIELAGLFCLVAAALTGLLSVQALVIYGLMVYVIVGLMSWCAIVMNNDFIRSYPTIGGLLRVGLIGLLEPIGYRQRDAFWRLQAWWCWSRGERVAWR